MNDAEVAHDNDTGMILDLVFLQNDIGKLVYMLYAFARSTILQSGPRSPHIAVVSVHLVCST